MHGRGDIEPDNVAAASRSGSHAHPRLPKQGFVFDLALETRLGFGRASQGLAIHDLRPADLGLDAAGIALACRQLSTRSTVTSPDRRRVS